MGSDNLTERLANLSPAKRALLELRLKEKSLRHVTQSIARGRTRDTSAPLSFAQQRLWFLNQLEPESSAYNESSALRLSGSLDIVALNQALNQLVARHEVLRTTIVTVDGSPRQVVASHRDVDLPVIDLRAVPQVDRDSEAQRSIAETIRKPFDLSRDLMLRVLLLQLADQEHIFLVVKHHIASDGWSTGILWRELTSLYRTSVSGEPSPLPELPIQYSDYAVWQKEWLKGAVLERQLSYWKKQLAGIGFLRLPTDRPRPAVQSYRGARQCLPLPDALWEKLNLLSRREQVTLFMTLLAAFQTLLYRYTGQNDVAVGCPIAGRTREELEGLIGFFVNTLVMRVDVSGNPTFRELLTRVREVALEAYAHQDVPFEKLVEELKPERNVSHSALFQIAFAYQNTPKHALDIPGVVVTPVEKSVETTKFDLHFSVNSADEGIGATVYYNTDFFDEATIGRMLGHFRNLLENIVTNPEQRISDLPMLTRTEKHQLLVEWNDTRRGYPKDKCIHQLFEEQVERSPDAVAVIFEDQQLTYRELNSRANQLAHYLRMLGVGPETLVGICVERSLEMVVGLLGILKAGGAYVPLDPEYPEERLAFIWEDAHISVLLSQEHLIETLPPFAGTMVCVDTEWERISRESNDNPDNGAITENLAYVIYTSGSTGRPKGVQIPHYAVINVLTHVREAFGMTAQDAMPLLANICFDISVMECLLPLISGSRLVVVSSDAVSNGTRIEQLLSACGVTLMQATPATWRLLLLAGWRGGDNLAILSGGEALPSDLAGELAVNGRSLWNLYGPTETTIYSSAVAYRAALSERTVSIGRPIANTQLYILDPRLEPVPVGVSGQLHIGGDGLARGYLKRADLTAASFIPNPFDKEPGTRLYRTGDLARYLTDGNIEFLGRVDHQIKLRGFRIELGEIETVLSEHPKVCQPVVLAREDIPGDKQLVAYVVPEHGASSTADELRVFLKDKLPDYMVPSMFVFMDAMPLTPNGKLDRKALPAPDRSNFERANGFVAPRTLVEEMIAEIWTDVLKLDKLGIDDNFFDLGGHSLKATQVISRVRQTFRMDLPLRVLFEAPTLAEFASRVQIQCSGCGRT